MNRWLILDEREAGGRFDPLDLVRPAFMLRDGAFTNAERWIALLSPTQVIASVRPWLAAPVAERTGWTVNRLPDEPVPDDVWIISVYAVPVSDPRWENLAFPEEFLWSKEDTRVLRLSRPAWERSRESMRAWIENCPRGHFPESGVSRADGLPLMSAEGPWHLIAHLSDLLRFDWQVWQRTRSGRSSCTTDPAKGVFVLGPEAVWCGRSVRIDSNVTVDARPGPVIIDEGVTIESFTRIDGPAYIGPGSALLGGKFTGGCAIGPGCKLGGEWEASIAQGLANKAHAGFFGHGYLGEWVNLGAMTTNSDLKNTYGTVRVERHGESVDTGQVKVGSFLADHTKTGIGTLLPTGSTCGVGVNIFAGGLSPKSLPSFVWGGPDGFVEHRIDKMIETAGTVVARRAELLRCLGRPDRLTEPEADLLRRTFAETAGERHAFLDRAKR